jgi:hypothetical protein
VAQVLHDPIDEGEIAAGEAVSVEDHLVLRGDTGPPEDPRQLIHGLEGAIGMDEPL